MMDDFQWKVNFHIELKVKEALDYYRISSDGLFQFLENYTWVFFHKENSKVLLFEKDRGFLCNPIGCNSACTFVLSNRNTETTFTPFKWQYFTALFFQKMLLRRDRLVFYPSPEYQRILWECSGFYLFNECQGSSQDY